MRAVRLARFAGIALSSILLFVSGAYVIIDLARWEWNRAVISALVFLSALVVLVTMILFHQLRRVEQRLDDLERHRQDADTALSALRGANAQEPSRSFRWLRQPPDRLGVFIPVLLGAGVLLSFVAYLVERIAGLFASSTVDRRTIRHLAPDLPLGPGMFDPWTLRASRNGAHHPVVWTVTVLATLVLAIATIQGLRELTQSRPGEVTSAGTTTVVLEIGQSRHIRPVEVVAEDLWASCRLVLTQTVEVTALSTLDAGTVRLDLDRALGRTGQARLTGCFQDYTLPLVQGDVVSLVAIPAEADAR